MALARGGEFIVFASGELYGDNQARLHTRRLDGLEIARLGEARAFMPVISPDGEWVAYVDNSSRVLAKIALAGGAPFELGTSTRPPFWAEDGYIYFANTSPVGLSRIPENGGDAELFAAEGLPEGARPVRVHLLPGSEYALLDLMADREDAGIAVLELATGQTTLLVGEGTTPSYVASGNTGGHVLWVRAGVLYATPFDLDSRQRVGRSVPVLQDVASGFLLGAQYAVSADGTLAWIPGESRGSFAQSNERLTWHGESGAEPVFDRTEDFRDGRISPEGGRIAVDVRPQGGGQVDVWILDQAQSTLARLTTAGGRTPVWSPDGEWIYFERSQDIWRRRSDFSGAAEPVWESDGTHWPVDITPDGATLVVSQSNEGGEGDRNFNGDLLLVPVEGGEPVALLASGFDEISGRVSPDGSLVAYVSDETGTRQVYVRELAGERRWAVSPGPGARPLWSRDGEGLYYRADDQILFAEMTYDGSLSQVPPRVAFGELGEFNGPTDVAADGRFLGLTVVVTSDSEETTGQPHDRIRVRLNWFQELERLAPRDQ